MSTRLVRQLVIRTVTLLVVCGAGIRVAPAQSQGYPVLWNKLGSDEEVLNSAYGPNLEFYSDGGGIDVPANRTYVAGVFGGAVVIDDGPYYTCARVHNLVLDDLYDYISPERGTVEVWYKQITDPVAYSHNPYRVFGGSFGLGSGMAFESQGDDPVEPRFQFVLHFGGSPVRVYSLEDGYWGYDISPYNGTWIHLAGAWDRSGIAGTADTMRLYLDGEPVATATDDAWGSSVGSRVDICGGNDGNLAHKFYMDNLIVWDYAKTDFSDRFCESPLNEPPVCDAGGPYNAECQGETTSIQLDGSGSYDPDPGDTLSYAWLSSCPDASFDDSSSATPTLTLTSTGWCTINCTVLLFVTDSQGATTLCCAGVTVTDTTPPAILATASDEIVECDGAGNVDELNAWLASQGGAVASDVCNGVNWSDDFTGLSDDCGATGSATVTFTATDDCGLSSTTTATFTIEDTTPPEITCPADVTVTCPEPTDPNAVGWAAATDVCDEDPAVSIYYLEGTITPWCLADPVMYTILRTWIATDTCGNSSECVQTITVMKVVLDLDIKPGSCPNSFNRGSRGVLPVALLGTADFDVTTVDLPSVRLLRADCGAAGASVAPHEGPPGPHSVWEDVATPFGGEPCDCHELEGDGIVDLSMKFKTDELVPTLELDSLSPGALVALVVSGTLADGCEFIATDCVRLVPPGTPPGQMSVSSNMPGVWLDVSPLDNQLDGGGFADFERTFPLGTVATLTASPVHQGYAFAGWKLDGVLQSPGTPSIEVLLSDELTTLRAIYRPWSIQPRAVDELSPLLP